MEHMKYLSKAEMMSLPLCTRSYIVLHNYIIHNADRDLYRKIISEYLEEIPVFELMQILHTARIMFLGDYQDIVDLIFIH